VDLQVDRRLNLSKGFAYVEFSNALDAEKAQAFMDNGQLDGNKLKVTFVLVSKKSRQPSPGDFCARVLF
jgi:RNA recognition motif-containing protein